MKRHAIEIATAILSLGSLMVMGFPCEMKFDADKTGADNDGPITILLIWAVVISLNIPFLMWCKDQVKEGEE